MKDLKLAIYEAYANDDISEDQCDAMIESLENSDNIDDILVESVINSYRSDYITYEDACNIFIMMDEVMTEACDEETIYEFTLNVIDFLEASKEEADKYVRKGLEKQRRNALNNDKYLKKLIRSQSYDRISLGKSKDNSLPASGKYSNDEDLIEFNNTCNVQRKKAIRKAFSDKSYDNRNKESMKFHGSIPKNRDFDVSFGDDPHYNILFKDGDNKQQKHAKDIKSNSRVGGYGGRTDRNNRLAYTNKDIKKSARDEKEKIDNAELENSFKYANMKPVNINSKREIKKALKEGRTPLNKSLTDYARDAYNNAQNRLKEKQMQSNVKHTIEQELLDKAKKGKASDKTTEYMKKKHPEEFKEYVDNLKLEIYERCSNGDITESERDILLESLEEKLN